MFPFLAIDLHRFLCSISRRVSPRWNETRSQMRLIYWALRQFNDVYWTAFTRKPIQNWLAPCSATPLIVWIGVDCRLVHLKTLGRRLVSFRSSGFLLRYCSSPPIDGYEDISQSRWRVANQPRTGHDRTALTNWWMKPDTPAVLPELLCVLSRTQTIKSMRNN